MKTVNGLFEKIVDKENILQAIRNAAKGKKKKTVVRYALRNADKIAEKLQDDLIKGTWRPSSVHKVKIINDGIHLKKREIICPDFIHEQVIHHAIMQIVKPVLIKRFYKYSCASIPERGVEYAVKYIRNAIKDYRGTKYFVTLDIKKFFNSIKPSTVFHQLRKIIRDKRTLKLFSYILRGNKVITEDENTIKRGTPIGFYTSPWFANLLLTPLDNLIKQDIKYYVRYNDDMLLFSSNKRTLAKTVASIIGYLGKISLKVKNIPQIHKRSKVSIKYIGVTIHTNRIVLASKVFLKAKRAARRIESKGYITTYDARRMLSYSGRFRHLNTYMAYMKYIEPKVKHKECRKIISKGDKKNVARKSFFKRKTTRN